MKNIRNILAKGVFMLLVSLPVSYTHLRAHET